MVLIEPNDEIKQLLSLAEAQSIDSDLEVIASDLAVEPTTRKVIGNVFVQSEFNQLGDELIFDGQSVDPRLKRT